MRYLSRKGALANMTFKINVFMIRVDSLRELSMY